MGNHKCCQDDVIQELREQLAAKEAEVNRLTKALDEMESSYISARELLIKEKVITKQEKESLMKTLELAKRLVDEAIPRFDWGRSSLDANAIRLLNEVPIEINKALSPKEASDGR